MGLVKSLLDDSGLHISFLCPNPHCECTIEDEVEDTFFDWGNDSVGDGVSSVDTTLSCPECYAEYEINVVAGPGEKNVEIRNFPDVEVSFEDNTYLGDADDREYEDFLAQWEPSEPYEVFQAAVMELDDLDRGANFLAQRNYVFSKMLFVQHIVLLEVYLSDRLISVVMNDDTRRIRLIGAAEELRTQKPTLIEIAKDPDFVKTTTKGFLQRASFHNLAGIAPYFKAVLDVQIFESDELKAELVKIIETRHHLVHRNGRTNDGTSVLIVAADVLKAKLLIKGVVDRVEAAYQAYAAAKP